MEKDIIFETAERYIKLKSAYELFTNEAKVADSFCKQLTHIELDLASKKSFIQERLSKSANYFHPQIVQVRDGSLSSTGLEIENKETKRRIKERLEEILVSLIFDIETLIKTRTACQLEDKLSMNLSSKRGLYRSPLYIKSV